MKVLTLFLFVLFWKEGNCQTNHYSTNDGYLFNVLARNILTPGDTTGVAVLQVTKKDSLIYVRIIYNSLSNFTFFNREYLKDRESRLPDGYTRIVPVHFYFDARDSLPEKPPGKELLAEADNRISRLKSKYTITQPLKLVSYGVVH
jgi:hypothetical protein